MSGGPPHHPHNHNRQVPTNSAWNHLQVPSYFPTQPQLAHTSSEHSIPYQYQATWHKPLTTESMKMFKMEPLFPRDCVDLSRNGNQNGERLTTPISLSVRDANKINSLPPDMLEIQAVELTKGSNSSSKPQSLSPGLMMEGPTLKSLSPGLKSVSPGLKSASPSLKSVSPGMGTSMLPSTETKTQKRSNVRVDSILERLNPGTEMYPLPEKAVAIEKTLPVSDKPVSVAEKSNPPPEKISLPEKSVSLEVRSEPVVEVPVKDRQDDKVSTPVQGVIVQAVTNYDENSNSSSIVNVPTCSGAKEDDTGSLHSNEDSLDGNKSRRKRKPSKTVRVSKEDDTKPEVTVGTVSSSVHETADQKDTDPLSISSILEDNKALEAQRSSDELDALIPAKTRRKTSSESETIDDIAAMVQEGLKEKERRAKEAQMIEESKVEEMAAKPISVSVIKNKDKLSEMNMTSTEKVDVTVRATADNTLVGLVTPAQKKASNTHFVEVENKLEEMFAGIEDTSDPLETTEIETPQANTTLEIVKKLEDDSLIKIEDPSPAKPLTSQDVSSTSTEVKKKSTPTKKSKRKADSSGATDTAVETTPTKKKSLARARKTTAKNNAKAKNKKSTLPAKAAAPIKESSVKDIFAYDSGSNASSSRSRGPFIQIRGPRDSPISVSVINTPVTDEDGERKVNKTKKFHDDSEYRQKVRSKGLHCSTLSNKYDAQTKDTTWICAFCKRGSHANDLTGPTWDGKVLPAGDLFGPYFITSHCPEFERRLDDPYDKQFKSKKITKVLAETVICTKSGKKSKRKLSEGDIHDDRSIHLGIVDTGNDTYEIWAHEDCIVWSPGVYLIGPKIVGLEEAVWTACNVSCKVCQLKGANICCLKRGCMKTVHLCCARQNNWQFDEDNYKAFCPEHRLL